VSAQGAKLVALFVLGALLLNFPALAVWNRAATLAGVPVLYLYLFGIWAAGILAVLVLAKRPWDEGDGE
jgi:hypothetical protein